MINNTSLHRMQGIGSARVKSKPTLVKPSTSKSFVSKHTAIEMTTDRPGLLSEISAVLTDLYCNIVEAHAWCHNAQLASVVHFSDQSSLSPIDDPNRLASIEEHLTMVLHSCSLISLVCFCKYFGGQFFYFLSQEKRMEIDSFCSGDNQH